MHGTLQLMACKPDVFYSWLASRRTAGARRRRYDASASQGRVAGNAPLPWVEANLDALLPPANRQGTLRVPYPQHWRVVGSHGWPASCLLTQDLLLSRVLLLACDSRVVHTGLR